MAGLKLQTLSSAISSSLNLVTVLLVLVGLFEPAPCRCNSRVSQKFGKKLGLLFLEISFLGFPPSISSGCSCLKLCPLVLQSVRLQVFYQIFTLPTWCRLGAALSLKATKMRNSSSAVPFIQELILLQYLPALGHYPIPSESWF